MPATTISGYSTGLNQTAPGSPQLFAPVKANEHYGRVRCSSFKVTLAAQASGTSLAMCVIPKGARILSGSLSASGTLANSATLAVGLAGKDGSGFIDDAVESGRRTPANAAVTVGTPISDSTTCLKAAAAQGAAQVPFAITNALGYCYETAKEVYLTITTGTGAVTTEEVWGHVLYVVD